ncbi:MAG: DUF1146 family protein [Erysipelotrichaceae bacterium]|nr:DUF1146 family protein [Erysipelotrichaceae bacterium]
MTKFFIKALIYLFCFILSLFGLSALDYNRFLKQNRVAQAQTLYFVIAFSLAYLMGTLIINLIYTLQ